MQLILALFVALQSVVVLAAPTSDDDLMDKATLFYECLRTVAEPNQSIEEETHTRFFCRDKVDRTHHTAPQISADAEKWIADQHRRCAGAAQDLLSCMLWRYDPASRPYIKCLALNETETDKDVLMNYCVVADREFQQCTQVWNKRKGTAIEIEEYCLSGKIHGREVNAQQRAGKSAEASRSPSNANAQPPTNNVASAGGFAKSFLAFLGAIYAIGTLGSILLPLVVLAIAVVLLLLGRVVSSLKWSSREVAQSFRLPELETSSLSPMMLRWIMCIPGALVAGYLAWLMVFHLNRAALSAFGADPEGTLSKGYIEAVSHIVMGAAFVYAGSRIAPRSRKVVLLLLTTLAIPAVLSLFLAVGTRNWWATFDFVCLALGAAIVGYSVATRKVDPNTRTST